MGALIGRGIISNNHMSRTFALIVGAAMMVSACAVDHDRGEPRLFPDADPNACFPARFVHERRVLDPRRVVVRSRGDQLYLVELKRPLYGITTNKLFWLMDRDDDGFICRSLVDGVMFQGGGTNIIAVTKLEPSQIQMLEQRYGSDSLPYKAHAKDPDVKKPEGE